MEKTITINGKELKLKATAMNLIIHQAEFGTDMFKDKKAVFDAITDRYTIDIGNINSLAVCRMIWTFAKTADNSFPSFQKWMEEQEELPVIDLFNEVYELFMTNMNQTTEITGKNSGSTETEEEEKAPNS